MGDLDVRIAWVVTVIKTAPMLGLFGTVVGMMGAFGKLAGSKNVNPTDLAGDIRVGPGNDCHRIVDCDSTRHVYGQYHQPNPRLARFGRCGVESVL